MANAILRKFDAKTAFTITAASLATATARQSTMVADSTNRPGAMVYARLKSGAVAPTAGTTYDVYLLRGDDAASSTYRTDGAGASDAAITVENAALLGSIVVTATAAKNFYGEWDTAPLGPLGPEWGIAVFNRSGQALSTTGSDHLLEYAYYYDEVQ